MIVVHEEITQSELLLRYVSGQRRFHNLDVCDDGSDALVGAHLDNIEIIDCFVVASFRNASLKNAVVHANVKTCDFSGADLSGSDFRGAALCATVFTGANMEGADFTGAFYFSDALGTGEKPDW
ncbi:MULTISPECIES: pentapeptide repeat-containing protein [unclassified Sphingopyxis]|uniref:pentapeptide repeat-containing protein n=1 Tax=unclassified Sphingopyxis TaxID=2614943 RepID=UPI0006FAFC71|nr:MULTISPECIES: pentapeptide repeat-containing protein [unclassified Sphingopyxis]KQZ69031.1 hypothetical protein ASD73_21935 [Sphingopyxis sp. Root154]KRC10350.1 hypothetical protein ASE06_02265 [Sphingopyxis sp. Root214]MDR7059373.1 uncharacterized protein YjbI with pentapeptide repeats [Sphingopyxis sp. BE235]MDR7178441.1 uncharacterized protein YjbI with pentapeptide repeats [Sphingopyxis sp. BE249]